MKFKLGHLFFTANVAVLCDSNADFKQFVAESFKRYCKCDWGTLCEEDAKQNDDAVESGDDRILASYPHPTDESLTIWIITEWDRSATTILFPREY